MLHHREREAPSESIQRQEVEVLPHLGIGELLIILLIVVLIFGVGKLPEIGGALGRSIREFRQAVSGKEEAREKKE